MLDYDPAYEKLLVCDPFFGFVLRCGDESRRALVSLGVGGPEVGLHPGPRPPVLRPAEEVARRSTPARVHPYYARLRK
jgi:hypothetical protein